MKTPSTKVDDEDILALNSVGLSLRTISNKLDCHHTTITYRLRANGVQPADTRRNFMEDIFNTLTTNQQRWLMDQLGLTHSVKDFVRGLIIEAYVKGNKK